VARVRVSGRTLQRTPSNSIGTFGNSTKAQASKNPPPPCCICVAVCARSSGGGRWVRSQHHATFSRRRGWIWMSWDDPQPGLTATGCSRAVLRARPRPRRSCDAGSRWVRRGARDTSQRPSQRSPDRRRRQREGEGGRAAAVGLEESTSVGFGFCAFAARGFRASNVPAQIRSGSSGNLMLGATPKQGKHRNL
jgi:hypothetical protein